MSKRKPKPKAGRPARSTGAAETKITARVTSDEMGIVDEAASRLGKTRAEFVRDAALAQASRVLR